MHHVSHAACRAFAVVSIPLPALSHQVFWASQTDADTQIGRLLRSLENRGLLNNTIIIFSTGTVALHQFAQLVSTGQLANSCLPLSL
jgi:membrane-anchored protein YejM (alkaline phosphatase superfamily)